MCCGCQGSDEIQRNIRRLNAIVRIRGLLARHAVDEVVVPHDDEQEREDGDKGHNDQVIHFRDL